MESWPCSSSYRNKVPVKECSTRVFSSSHFLPLLLLLNSSLFLTSLCCVFLPSSPPASFFQSVIFSRQHKALWTSIDITIYRLSIFNVCVSDYDTCVIPVLILKFTDILVLILIPTSWFIRKLSSPVSSPVLRGNNNVITSESGCHRHQTLQHMIALSSMLSL